MKTAALSHDANTTHGFRLVRATPIRFSNQPKLFGYLHDTLAAWSGKTTIMAGHYILFYRHATDQLVPLMNSNIDPDNEDEQRYVADVGDFPEASFAIAVRLVASFCHVPIKLALLVNDRQLKLFQEELPDEKKLTRLRHDYYRQSDPLPDAFRQILCQYPTVVDPMERNDERRRPDSTLPSKTVFFSENVLKNRFERYGKTWSQKFPGFTWTSGVIGPPRLLFNTPFNGRPLCLLEESRLGDSCGCTGVMLEFLSALAQRGAKNILLFIPDECRLQVDESVKATMSVLPSFENIIAVWADPMRRIGSARFTEATAYSVEPTAPAHHTSSVPLQ